MVRIGAIALEMTGMEASMARFQALSAFSGAGFITREAERIVNHPRRRKIVTYLIILGNAGIVSVIATFVLTLRGAGTLRPSLNLLIILGSVFVLYRITMSQKFGKKLSEKIRNTLRNKFHFERVHIEEILSQSDGFGVASILVGKESKIAGLTLSEARLTQADLVIFSIERDEGMIPIPKAQTKIQVGEQLVCYCKLANLEKLV